MAEHDNLLQRRLEQLEAGEPLEQVLHDLPAGAEELADLLRLAAAIRSSPHPELAPEAAALPNWRLRPARRAVLLGGLAALLFAAVGLAAWAWSTGWPLPQSASLLAVQGPVEVTTAEAGSGWQPASAGARLRAGQQVRTGPAGFATLGFFEGSQVEIGPNTQLSLTALSSRWPGSLRAELTQSGGRTAHRVSPLRGASAGYTVTTGAGAVHVQGTTFSVALGANGRARYSVEHGRVLLAAGEQQLVLAAGWATVARPGEAPDPPARLFSGQGRLESTEGSSWTIGGLEVQITQDTDLQGDPELGDLLAVAGRIRPDGTWAADSLEPGRGEGQAFTFSGELQAIAEPAWTIAGLMLETDAASPLAGEMAPGDPVLASFEVTEGGLRLLRAVERLETPPAEGPPQPVMPSLSFEPDELELSDCGEELLVFTGALVNDTDDAKNVAQQVELGHEILRGSDLVESVEIEPSGWEQIAAGQSESFSVTVRLIDAQASPGEVKLQVFIAAEANRPGGHPTRLTLAITLDCPEQATPTPEPVETPPADEELGCTKADPHPAGLTLAERYGVGYQEMMGWFCGGFGFGEIDLAYGLSRETGVSVEEVFTMRSSGLGWGEIKQQLGVLPGKPPSAPAGPPWRP